MIFRLRSGLRTPFSRARKTLRGVHDLERNPESFLEVGSDPFGFPFPEYPVVHEDAVEPVSDRSVDEHGSDRRVHPARSSADHLSVSHLSPDSRHRARRVGPGRPSAPRPAHLEREIPEDGGAVLGVHYFGMELHPVEPTVGVFEGGNTRLPGSRGAAETVRQRVDEVSVAGPGTKPFGNPGEKTSAPIVPKLRGTVRAAGRRTYVSAAFPREQLHPVADPKHRNRWREHAAGGRRRAIAIDALRPPGKDHSYRIPFPDIVVGGRTRKDLAIHPHFAETPGDQLRVLRAEIKDEQGFRRVHHRRLAPAGVPCPARVGRRAAVRAFRPLSAGNAGLKTGFPKGRTIRSNCKGACSLRRGGLADCTPWLAAAVQLLPGDP